MTIIAPKFRAGPGIKYCPEPPADEQSNHIFIGIPTDVKITFPEVEFSNYHTNCCIYFSSFCAVGFVKVEVSRTAFEFKDTRLISSGSCCANKYLIFFSHGGPSLRMAFLYLSPKR